MNNTNSILLVGSVALDTIETPQTRRENLLGGSVTYALVSASLESPVHVVGVVGKDFPAEGHELFRSHAAGLTDFQIRDGSTFRWGGRYHENMDQRKTLFTELGVFADFDPQLALGNCNHPYVFLANIHPALQLSVIEQCNADCTFVVDTMNLWIETTPRELEQVLARTDILLINESEAALLTGTEDLPKAAQALRERGPDTVVIKLGSQGTVVAGAETAVRIGVYPVSQVVDTTGAGDTFGGGFVSALARGMDLGEALINGAAWASFCVEAFGISASSRVDKSALDLRRARIRETLTLEIGKTLL
ncbi:MAG: PfkB family carbohydrate kinase [Fidelibacterota bacterium]